MVCYTILHGCNVYYVTICCNLLHGYNVRYGTLCYRDVMCTCYTMLQGRNVRHVTLHSSQREADVLVGADVIHDAQ